MKRRTIKSIVGTVGLLSLLVWTAFPAEPGATGKSQTQSLQRVGSPRYQILNINNLWTWARSDGQSNHSPTSDDGMYFPRGTKWVIYQDGFIFGGKPTLTSTYNVPPAVQPIRVGGATYNVGTQAGRIIGTGATAVAADPAGDDVRIYRIRRDYKEMTSAELARDAAESNEKLLSSVSSSDQDAIRAQYAKDWAEWPVAYGAPYIERNGTPGYQAPPITASVNDLIAMNYDEPGVAGADPKSPADQVIWTVFNDLNRSVSLGLYGSEPMGMEVQMTMWGYKRSDAMGNLYFKKYRLINKGGAETVGTTRGSFWIDSMYVAQWSDPDLGSFGDDLCGSDSVSSVGFVYNGNANDTEYRKFNLPPPSAGYDFLAGPIVPGAATDSAVFNLKRRYGFKNLPMTSFAYFSAGSGISDPPLTQYEGALRWFRMLKGFVPDASTAPERKYPFPPGVAETFFPLAGDPVTRSGHIDGQGTAFSLASGDRRIVMNSGPFRLAPGDTQEVVVGTVAGLGSDRLSSVAVMKFNDRFVQNTFNALFQVPKPPPAPTVKAAELDGQIILEWGSDLTKINQTETVINQPGAYKFEGYNVYQLPSRSSRLSEGKRIATYDLSTDPTVVLDEQFDPSSGQILRLPVQFGTNSGVSRFFNITRDYIRDIGKLNNGQEYYFVVTAYSVASVAGYLPSSLESEVQVVAAKPKVPFGTKYASKFGDTLKVSHPTGVSDGTVRPIVVDPTASTGQTYRVTFNDAGGGTTTWNLLNKATGDSLLKRQANQTGDENYNLGAGGLFLKVEGPPPGMKDWSIPNGTRRFTFADVSWGGLEGFEGSIGWTDPAFYFGSTTARGVAASELKNVLLKLAPATSATTGNPNAGGNPYGNWDVNSTTLDANYSKAYRYLRGATAAPARPEFAPYIVNATSGYPYQDYKYAVPLSAWNMETNPPTRLAVGVHENNVAAGLVDGKWWPPANGTGVTQSAVRDFLFIYNTPYTETPQPALMVNALTTSLPVMYWVAVNRRGGANFSAGDEFLILANHVNTTTDAFEFTTPAPQKGASYDKASADKVGVFPNPYYAFNPAETNRLVRFITFNNLPISAKIRIFNLAGQVVRTLDKNDASQFLRWDLNNQDNFPVASGMYIAHVEMTLPSNGSVVTKVLKIAVIQEQEVLDVF